MNPVVFAKFPLESLSRTIDLTPFLPVGDTVASVSLQQIYPTTTSPALTQGMTVGGPQALLFVAGGGYVDTTYGLNYDVVTVGAVHLMVQVILTVSDQMDMDTSSKDPYSFVGLVDEIIAGDSAIGLSSFMLPAGIDVTNGSVNWSLVDKKGTLHASGNCYDYAVDSTSFSTTVQAHALVHAPSSLPPSSEGNSYQLRWELNLPSQTQPMFSFESIRVLGLTSATTGGETAIELHGDMITVGTVLDKAYEKVELEIFDNMNCRILAPGVVAVNSPVRVAGGYYYTADIDPTNVAVTGRNPFKVQLDAYVSTWKYSNANSRAVSRMVSEIFIVNPSILSAMEDTRRLVMKAKTTQFEFGDIIFDDATILAWLRRARDLFNSAGGTLVEFSMTNATGGIREYWLRYAEVAMLRAHYLAEGEKAFNFAGAAIQLDVDKTQYYSGLADTLQQQLDADVKPFKQNLLKKGAAVGDGNMTNLAGSFAGASRLGISVHPASQLGRNGNRWY